MKKFLTYTIILILSLTIYGCQNQNFENPNEQYCQTAEVVGVYKCVKNYFAFDTTISFTLYVDETTTYDIETVYDDVNDMFITYDQLLDPYESFDGLNNLYTVNHSDGPTEVSETLFDAIQYALENQDINPSSDELLFNVALGPVLDIWHDARYSDECTQGLLFDRCPVPTEAVLSQSFNTDPNDVVLDEANQTISFNEPGMMIDLGGFAKGYISMKVETYLEQYEINYILNLGASNVLVGGTNTSKKSNNKFTIGLTKPEYETIGSTYYGAVSITDSWSVVSSGSYQRYFKSLDVEDDTYYHHIIDPRTKQPGGDAIAVTIITDQTGISDILSTAIFLMDYEDGIAYVNGVEGLEAIWYFSEDDIRMSEHFDDYFQYI